MTQPDLVLPIVHGNGTSRESLQEQLANAAQAVTAAIAALAEASPNARDYYVVPGLYERALAQHERRAKALRDLHAELEAEYLALDEVGR